MLIKECKFWNFEESHLILIRHSGDGILQKCRLNIGFCLESSSSSTEREKLVEINGVQNITEHQRAMEHQRAILKVLFKLHQVLMELGTRAPGSVCVDGLRKNIRTRRPGKDHQEQTGEGNERQKHATRNGGLIPGSRKQNEMWSTQWFCDTLQILQGHLMKSSKQRSGTASVPISLQKI